MYNSLTYNRGGVYSNAKFCYLNTRHPVHRGGGVIGSIDAVKSHCSYTDQALLFISILKRSKIKLNHVCVF